MHLKGIVHPGDGEALNAASAALTSHGDPAMVRLDETAWSVAPNAVVRGPLLCAFEGAPRRRTGHQLLSAEDILRDYEQRGTACIGELSGAFALALVDAAKPAAYLAVDRMGIGRVTYAADGRRLVFSTRADDVTTMAELSRDVGPQQLFEFLFFHMMPSPDTVFGGVSKLPPAHMLEFSGGRCRVEPYWQPDFSPASNWNESEAIEELHAILSAAVDREADGRRNLGTFLSGGLDSSAVSGALSRSGREFVGSFSIGFDVPEFNELEFAREANRHFGIPGHEYNVTAGDIVADFERIAAAYDEPFGNSSVVPSYHCAKLAREHGVDYLLAGDGGDELFAGNERYGKQRVFELYGAIPAFLRESVVRRLAMLVSPDNPVTPLRKFRSYVDQASVPLPDRFEWWSYIYQEGLGSVMSPEALGRVNAERPLEHMRAVYAQTESEHTVDRMLAYDWRFTLADNDLRKVTQAAELGGVGVGFPLIDDALVEFSTRVPVDEKLRWNDLRYFFRKAMNGFLPPKTLEKSKHGFGLPFGVWLKTDAGLREMVIVLLRELADSGALRNGFVDDLIEAQKSGDAGYFGYFIWDLAMFQAWCRTHDANFRC